jgi:hypothetical protein
MPLRLNVGASQKVSDNHYGSRGASVNLELELDSGLVAEPARLQEKIRQLFALVRTSLAEELNGANGHRPSPTPAKSTPPVPANGSSGAGNGQRSGAIRPATPAQCKALYALARQQGLDLADWLYQHAQVRRPDDLTVRQASGCIDALKAPANP